MLKTADAGLRAVPFPVDDPERIPVQRYFDPEFYQLEVEHLWPHVWQMACRLEQIPEAGDWIEYQNLGKSVIIVNTGEAGIKAYHNACRHRGVPIAGGKGNDHGNCARSGFVCPFHGWRFNMHGENTEVYGRELFSARQLEHADLNLIPCRVETAIGCAFINYDDDAPSLRDTHRPADRAARGTQSPQAARRMVLRHGASSQLEDRDGSLHGRLPRDEDPPAAAGGIAADVRRAVS